MVNYYTQTYRVYQKDVMVQSHTVRFLAEDDDPSLKGTPRTEITWEGLFDWEGHNPWVDFSVRQVKKGKQIVSFCFAGYDDVNEWKSPETTTLSFEVEDAKPCKASLEDIFKYYDGELAIKYLAEHGTDILKAYMNRK